MHCEFLFWDVNFGSCSSSRPGVPTREDEAGRGHDIDLVPCIHVQGKGEPRRTSCREAAENSMAESTESLLITVGKFEMFISCFWATHRYLDTCPTMISSQQVPKPWEKARGLTQFALAALWQQLGTCNSATAQPNLVPSHSYQVPPTSPDKKSKN